MTRRARVLSGALAILAVALSGAVLDTAGAGEASGAPAAPRVATARVARMTLTATTAEGGILTYRAQADGSPYAVINRAAGTYTSLPAVGAVIAPGHVLYRVDNAPVVLLHGTTPAYRALSAGISGPDVAELNADLVALGYAPAARLRPRSAFFGPATTAAVKRLEAAVGLPSSGALSLGRVVFEPVPMRVTSVPVPPGGEAQAGQTVVVATSITRQVQVALDSSARTGLAVGNTVSIVLPNDRTTPGVVSSVATVATCPSGAGQGSGSGAAAPGTDSCPSGGSPTIAVAVTPSHPGATGTWDQAPVQVAITTASVPDALVVPVTALLARSGGGYAVELSSAGAGVAHHLVAVTLGLFDDAEGLVQITAPGLAAGQRVVVPST